MDATIRTFNKSVRGSLHILRNVPCEDSSVSFSSDDGTYHIAIVSDGHGDSRCFRSQYGSAFATEVTLVCLKEFAEYAIQTNSLFDELQQKPEIIRHLTDTIIARWYDRVIEDFHAASPNEQELELIGEQKAEDISEENTLHIYGATLMAALWLPNVLVLLHQGDGRCDVFFQDGRIEQPIPWDDRCENTTTTSLCDSDAEDRFRSYVIDLNKDPVAACYLGCDGVEDAFRDSTTSMEGVHTFYKDLSCKLLSMGSASFQTYLEEFLPEFSKNGQFGRCGSGDDVSVAGIVNTEALSEFRSQFLTSVHRYEMSEQLFWLTDERNGKIRKHEILERRLNDASEKYERSKAEREKIKRKLTSLKVRQSDLLASLKEENENLGQLLSSSQQAVSQIEEALLDNQKIKKPLGIDKIGHVIDQLQEAITFSSKKKDSRGKRRRKQAQICRELQLCAKQCTEQEKELERITEDVEEKKRLFQEAKDTFNEYDITFQAIESEITRITAELSPVIDIEDTNKPITIPEESLITDTKASDLEETEANTTVCDVLEHQDMVQDHQSDGENSTDEGFSSKENDAILSDTKNLEEPNESIIEDVNTQDQTDMQETSLESELLISQDKDSTENIEPTEVNCSQLAGISELDLSIREMSSNIADTDNGNQEIRKNE